MLQISTLQVSNEAVWANKKVGGTLLSQQQQKKTVS